MSIETITKLLEGNDKKAEILEDVKNTIKEDVDAKEKELNDTHKKELSKRNSENKSLRDRVKKMEKLTEDLELDIEDDDFDEKLQEIKDKLEKLGKDGGTDARNTPEYKALEKKIKKLEEKSESDDKEKAKLKKERQQSKARKDILAQLKENKVLKAREEDLADLLMIKVKFDEDGNATLNIDGEEHDFKEGIKKWIEPRAEFIENGQNPGGGSGKGGGTGVPNKKPEDMTPTDKLAAGFAKTQ